MSLAGFEKLVAEHEVHYYVAGGGGFGGGGGVGSGTRGTVGAAANRRDLAGRAAAQRRGPDRRVGRGALHGQTVGGMTMYNLTAAPSA